MVDVKWKSHCVSLQGSQQSTSIDILELWEPYFFSFKALKLDDL